MKSFEIARGRPSGFQSQADERGNQITQRCAVNVTIAKLSSRSYPQIDKYLTFDEAIISRKKKSLMGEEDRSVENEPRVYDNVL